MPASGRNLSSKISPTLTILTWDLLGFGFFRKAIDRQNWASRRQQLWIRPLCENLRPKHLPLQDGRLTQLAVQLGDRQVACVHEAHPQRVMEVLEAPPDLGRVGLAAVDDRLPLRDLCERSSLVVDGVLVLQDADDHRVVQDLGGRGEADVNEIPTDRLVARRALDLCQVLVDHCCAGILLQGGGHDGVLAHHHLDLRCPERLAGSQDRHNETGINFVGA